MLKTWASDTCTSSPVLHGSIRKVGQSNLNAHQEFYQLLTYTDDVDLLQKLRIWEDYYNFNRPHGALGGKTPYEVLRDKLTAG
jgi:transposase InsO family protein